MEDHTKGYWEEQADLALKYALARPASDLNGFFQALRDREEFLRLAASLPSEGAK